MPLVVPFLRRAILLNIAIIVAVIRSIQPAMAAGSHERDLKHESEIEQQVAKLDPSLVAPFRDARIAFDAGKYAEAEKLLSPICERYPTFDIALRRLGAAKVLLGQREVGLSLAEKAVDLNRSYDNLANLASLIASASGATTADNMQGLKLLREAESLPHVDEPDALLMIAQLGFRVKDLETTRNAVAKLGHRFPQRMETHLFAAYLAAYEEKWNQAVREIKTAERLGLAHDEVAKFLDSGIQTRATGWFVAGTALWVLLVWAAGLVSLFALGFVLSKSTLRQVERSDPAVPVTPTEHRLRRIYRSVINVAGLYYYVSLPIVLVLVVGLAGAVIYGFLIVGHIPIKLALIVIIGAIATVVAMVRSLFIKVKSEEPGRALTRAEAPGMWQLAEEVAASVQTRPIDEIRITIGTDLCVYERGNWREKMENRAKRILVIGAAVLDGFKQEDFRCVLAHEYGHFSNRDTAGGDIALRVMNDMVKFYIAMAQAGQATWLNLGFHFLRAYHFIFRRISRGATRLQEVLADRVAAQNYGALAFEGGLRHVIRQSIAFDAHANGEIESAIKAGRPLQHLYVDAMPLAPAAEDRLQKALSRETTDDDTHPAPKDRFRLVAKVPAPNHAAASGYVWDLFTDRSAILDEMTATVEKNIARHRK